MKKELKQGDYVMVGDGETGYYPGIIIDGPFAAQHGGSWFEVNMDGHLRHVHDDKLIDSSPLTTRWAVLERSHESR